MVSALALAGYQVVGFFLAYVITSFVFSKKKRASGAKCLGVDHDFGAFTTCDEVAKMLDTGNCSIKGKTVMITGANVGLGLETSRCLAVMGAKVILLSRSKSNGDAAIERIVEKHPETKNNVSTMCVDLASFASIRAFASSFIASKQPLHILINNAGQMAPPRTLTEDGFEMQIGVNHLAHFLLTGLLMETLEAAGTDECPSRVINLSSFGNWIAAPKHGISLDDLSAEDSYDLWARYGESKLANILFTRELQRRIDDAEFKRNVLCVSVHPGQIFETGLQRHMASKEKIGFVVKAYERGWLLGYLRDVLFFKKSIPQGAATVVYCALQQPAFLEKGKHYFDCKVSDMVHESATLALQEELWSKSEQVSKKKK